MMPGLTLATLLATMRTYDIDGGTKNGRRLEQDHLRRRCRRRYDGCLSWTDHDISRKDNDMIAVSSLLLVEDGDTFMSTLVAAAVHLVAAVAAGLVDVLGLGWLVASATGVWHLR